VDLIVYLIILGVQGLVVGAFARLALPGRDPMSLLQTMAVGLAGSFVAGLVVWFVTDGQQAGAGFLASLVVSVLIVYFIRRSRGGGLTNPRAGESGRRF